MGAAAIPTATELLKAKEWRVRQAAAEALGWIGPKAKIAAPTLEELSNDENPHVRYAAEDALEKIKQEKK
jgi:HEAT repeat protein